VGGLMGMRPQIGTCFPTIKIFNVAKRDLLMDTTGTGFTRDLKNWASAVKYVFTKKAYIICTYRMYLYDIPTGIFKSTPKLGPVNGK
jgi:hypothetical protein